MKKTKQSRRSFVSSMAAAALGFAIVPRHVLGGQGFTAPSEKVNFAIVGAGGQGVANTRGAIDYGQNLVAIVDVDMEAVNLRVGGTQGGGRGAAANAAPTPAAVRATQAYAKATRYADFRIMLERERNNIDGVIVATPDHLHAVIAKGAMEMGKAVYVEKPLTWSVHEARVLAATAKRTGVVTQMGNQGHSMEGTKRIKEWIQAGVIGPVREIHVWTNRPIWPQGVPRPTMEALRTQTANPIVATAAPAAAQGGRGGQPGGGQVAPPLDTTFAGRNIQQPLAAAMGAGLSAPPPGVDWDLWIGPSKMVPFHPIYHPFNWRGWVDWGAGALGDMGAHLIDQPMWSLELDLPTSIEATSTPFGMDSGDTPATFPQAMTVHYEFAARGSQPPVKLAWYDGGLKPPRPDQLPDDITLTRGGGGYFVGTKGILLYDTYGNNPRLYPESLKEAADRTPQTQERVPVALTPEGNPASIHVANWANAIMGKAKASSSFDYASRLTETMLLGLVALRVGQGRKILYDGVNGQITNVPQANFLLTRDYRTGWSL
ncbi:MAG TPA: Gfo/Idh/MocA family oxidoreductase [Terriglobia bacterium]|nr:Gfo/Idh/MocA family oxidoreductase [Terriglobia bacterium]